MFTAENEFSKILHRKNSALKSQEYDPEKFRQKELFLKI
jgi:hypothetical protein